MKQFLIVIFAVLLSSVSFTQSIYPNNFSSYFANAYKKFPNVPKGVLEAISYTTTRMNHIDSTTPPSCTGIPRVYGVMGLTLDGKGVFRNNLITVSKLSGISIKDIINSPKKNILAFASAYSKLKKRYGIKGNNFVLEVRIIKELSELPNDNSQSDYPLNSHVYSVLKLLNEDSFAKQFKFSNYRIDLSKVFGENNLKVLSSKKVYRYGNSYKSEDGTIYNNPDKN